MISWKLIFLFVFVATFGLQCDKEENTGPLMLEEVCTIDERLPEISGIISIGNNSFIAHNDGGNGNILYGFSEPCEIQQEYSIEGATNNDWEAIAQDESFIYIGDFGNNDGDRTDLRIYQIPKTALENPSVTVSKTIAFSYASQSDFTTRNFHNFDCEAMIEFQDSLLLFTKNRADGHTDIYSLNKSATDQKLSKTGRLNAEGLVTDAIYNKDRDELILLVYRYSVTTDGIDFDNHLLIIEKFQQERSGATITKRVITERFQFESMVLLDNKTVMLTHETEDGGSAMMYTMKIH